MTITRRAPARTLLCNRATGQGETVIVHVRANLAGKIRRENRDGRETLVLPSYAAKAGTVLNGILYPREELDSSIAGLNRTPAPLGHPTINNKFVPALDPEALARNHVFAWNENPRWDGERIALDVVIDEARAKESEGGRKVLNAIDKQEPICTSTGLLCNLEEVKDRAHNAVARNIEWDHVALLLDEAPAISPEEGVGIFVNSASHEANETRVINSAIEDDAERELGWAVDQAVRALEKRRKAPIYERAMKALTEAILGPERDPSEQQNKDADMTVSKEQFDALSGEVKTLSDAVANLNTTIGETVANAIKPFTDAQAEALANAKAKDEAELTTLREKIVKANILNEDEAKELTLNAARALAKKAEPGKAAALNARFGGNDKDEFADVDLNAALEVK